MKRRDIWVIDSGINPENSVFRNKAKVAGNAPGFFDAVDNRIRVFHSKSLAFKSSTTDKNERKNQWKIYSR